MERPSVAWDLLGPARCAGCGTRTAALCRDCAGMLRRPPGGLEIARVDRVVSPWEYSGAARGLVLDLKARALRAASIPLADAVCEAVRRDGLVAKVVTWVPGRPQDVKSRGFDHAECLARRVAEGIGLPAVALLERRGVAVDQTGLGAIERRRNLEGAFVARPCASPVALVDDVVTTGATATSCATALKAAGTPFVELLVACRA